MERTDFELLERYHKSGDLEARNILVQRHYGFAIKMAKKFIRYGVPLDDLIQEAVIGLMRALETYDPSQGTLPNYASFWIRTRIQAAITKDWSIVKCGTTRLERRIYARLRQLPDPSDRPEVERFAEEVRGSIDEVTLVLRYLTHSRDVSLSTPLDPASHDGILEDMIGVAEDQYDTMEESELQGLLMQALEMLSDKERWVIEQRFLRPEVLTFRECGQHLGGKKQYAERIQIRALRKMRTFLDGSGYEACA